MNGTPDDWPRFHYTRLRSLPPPERDAALATVPAHLRAWVSLYLSMPEDEFAWMKTAARIARMRTQAERIAALDAIADPAIRRRVRSVARDLFYQRKI